MSLTDWTTYNAGDHPAQQLPPRPAPMKRTVDLEGIEVIEGPAAEISHRLYLERAERAQLVALEAERQKELDAALRLVD